MKNCDVSSSLVHVLNDEFDLLADELFSDQFTRSKSERLFSFILVSSSGSANESQEDLLLPGILFRQSLNGEAIT